MSWAARLRAASPRTDTGERMLPENQPTCGLCGVRSHVTAACPLPVCDDPMLGEDGTCWRCTWPLSWHERPRR